MVKCFNVFICMHIHLSPKLKQSNWILIKFISKYLLQLIEFEGTQTPAPMHHNFPLIM